MKKIYVLALAISAFSFSSYAQIDFQDDFESYSVGNISPQASEWRTWSGDENSTENGQVSTNFALSGSQSMMIGPGVAAGGPTDQLLLIDAQPNSGIYTIQFNMYIESGQEGYFNIQGLVDEPQTGSFLSPDLYFNPDNTTPGQGQTADASFVWAFPHDTWFPVTLVFDMDAQTFGMDVDGNEAIPAGTFFNDLTVPYLGAVDFFAASEFTLFYVDDVTLATGELGVNDFSANVFSVYPNPVKDVLNISSKASVDNVTVFDILGKKVLSVNPDAVSPSINMSNLASGAYMVKVTIGNASKTIKVIK